MTNDPVLIAYTVKDRRGQKSIWRRIGVAFPHDNGSGLTVLLDASRPTGASSWSNRKPILPPSRIFFPHRAQHRDRVTFVTDTSPQQALCHRIAAA